MWSNPELDLRVLETKIASIGNAELLQVSRVVVRPVARSSFNKWLRQFSKSYLDIVMIILGSIFFFYYEIRLPSAIYRKILLDNMSGTIIEVRQD